MILRYIFLIYWKQELKKVQTAQVIPSGEKKKQIQLFPKSY